LLAQASDELRRVSGIQDLDQLIKSFMLQESNNFSLLNYIQSMGQEVDQGIDVAEALEKDIKV
jgi:coiled-coil domain-containing protein 63/114